ncbi:anti-sigma factor domain-containing protein [Halobacillus sp. Marseille-P3879]|uniref:anti-sigma factor domain-containing protein n=1 Tax=Halobacillus sp. Marseille-P3879 TaxID=2045014 RepID=UPI000C7C1F97|nr:anti-sigma factor domain-containing protein [Halobacillus sp. Marseille-P3879]
MRKGIVMEQNKKFTIVMASDGTFHKAKRLKRAAVGMEVHFQPYNQSNMKQMFVVHRMKFAAVAAAVILTLFPAYIWHEENKAYAFVNVDINPSVEMEINDNMKVLQLNPLNEEAEQMIKKMEDWKKKPASEVALQMISLSKQEGYMSEEQEVLIGVSYIEGHDLDFSQEIENYLDQEIDGLMLASYNVPENVRKQAEDNDTSVNQLMAESLEEEESDQSLTKEEEPIEDDDLEIIQSFYGDNNSSKSDHLPEQSTEEAPPFGEEIILPDQKYEREHPQHEEDDPHSTEDEEKEMNHPAENGKQSKEKDEDHPSEKKEENGKPVPKEKEHAPSNNSSNNPESNEESKGKPEEAPSDQKEGKGQQNKDEDHPSQKKSNNNDKEER